MNYKTTPWLPTKGPKQYIKRPLGVQLVNTALRPETTGQRLKQAAVIASIKLRRGLFGDADARRLSQAARAFNAEPSV